MVCRDEKRGKEAQEEIIKESNNSNVELHLCDMSQPQDVSAFTNRFIQSNKPLNVMNLFPIQYISQMILFRCYVIMQVV